MLLIGSIIIEEENTRSGFCFWIDHVVRDRMGGYISHLEIV